MSWINWPAIRPDVFQVPTPLEESRAVVVMFEAERAKGGEPEGPPIISMWRVVIGDYGGGHSAGGEALLAQGLRS